MFHLHNMRKDLKEVYANQIIDKFAHSLLMIFIPIYLLSIGYNLAETMIYLLIPEVVTVLLAIPVGLLASRLGLKHTILYRIPLAVIFVLWLEYMSASGLTLINLIIAGFICGFSRTLYWIPFNSEFVENSDKAHRGSDVSLLVALPILVCVASPSMGGVILEYVGFYLLFSIFMILMIMSVIPFFMSQDYKKHFKFKRKDINFRLGQRFSLGFFAQGFFSMGYYLIWPLYIYMVLNNLVITGMVASFTVLGTAFLTILIGRVSDKMNRKKMLRFGVIGCFFIWLMMYFAVTGMEFFVLSFLSGVFNSLIIISIFSSFSDFAKDRNIVNDVAMREIYLSVGRAALFAILAFTFIGLHLGIILIAIMCLPIALVKVK